MVLMRMSCKRGLFRKCDSLSNKFYPPARTPAAMPSQQSIVDFIASQMAAAGDVSARKMFGEYGIWCDGKSVALVCDDQLFVKPTLPGRAFVGEDCMEAPAYRGAKPSLVIDADRWDDADWMARLIAVTAAALPLPKPKKAKPAQTR